MEKRGARRVEIKRLFFNKSKHRDGGKCYVAKLKYDPFTMERFTEGTLIVIGNVDGNMACGIDRGGRWDVDCMEMNSKKGWIVLSASPTVDVMEMGLTGETVTVIVNGRAESYRTRDGRSVELVFDLDNYYPPRKIADAIRRKAKYLQLPVDFDTGAFTERFLDNCSELERARKQRIISEITEGDGVGVDKFTENAKKGRIDKWKEKWGAK